MGYRKQATAYKKVLKSHHISRPSPRARSCSASPPENLKGYRKSCVTGVSFNFQKTIKLSNGHLLHLHRFAAVGPGDTILIPPENKLPFYVEAVNGLALLVPIYRRQESVRVGNQRLDVIFKEIETLDEFQGYQNLSDFHYRGVILHGRRVPLVATVTHPFLPSVIGYVELATTFIMNKPRSILFNSPFRDPSGKISWRNWNLEAMKKWTNVTVRIARCVLFPELRGLSLSRLLLKHAMEFARIHWQVNRLKPCFMEITADMLKYLPFAEKAGMHFIGFTEGNLKRVQKDMGYILKNYRRVKDREILKEEVAGIVDLQVSYADKLHAVQSRLKLRRNDLLKLLKFRNGRVSKLQYSLLHGLIRQPKATYMKGLDTTSENFVVQRLTQISPSKLNFTPYFKRLPLSGPVVFAHLSLTVNSRVPDTTRTRAIQEAFGIRPDHLSNAIFRDLNFEIKPQEILLVVGPSGTGKTLLLQILTGNLDRRRRRFQQLGGVVLPKNTRLGMLKEFESDKPLIELVGNGDVSRSIYILNMAGLSEAYLYLKRFSELSAGQQYRAMTAKLIDAESNLWVADEFCSALDPLTSYVVAQNIKKQAKLCGATVVVAAPHCSYFADGLQPDRVLYLTSGRSHTLFSGDEFLQHLSSRNLLLGAAR